MASLGNFNADDYENDYQPLPAGKYKAVITESESKPTAKGGEYLKLTVEIIEGQYKGRKVFGNLNLKNANPEAEKIARISLADICRAVGVTHPRDSSELHNKPLVVKLAIKPETAEYPAGNDIKGWEGIDKTPDMFEQPVTTPGGIGAPAPSPSGKKPWEK